MDILYRTNIKASCRLDRYQKLMFTVKFSCYNSFLLVAAGHTSCRSDRTLSGTNIELVYKHFRVFTDLVKTNETVILKIFFKIPLKDYILLKGIIKDKSVLMTVLWNMADTVCILITNTLFRNIFAVENNFTARLRFFKAGNRRYKFTLTVSVNTGYTYDLTTSDR